MPAVRRFYRISDAAVLDNKVYSVTAKNQTAISKDIHDYYSLAIFYWPSTNGSTVYQRIDGKINPEVYTISDETYLNVVINDVFNLAMSYYFSRNDAYAAKATSRLRQWFLDPATKMNPNLNFANWIKGTSLDVLAGLTKEGLTGGVNGNLISPSFTTTHISRHEQTLSPIGRYSDAA